MGALSQLTLSVERRTHRKFATFIKGLASCYKAGGEIADDPIIRASHASTNVALNSIVNSLEHGIGIDEEGLIMSELPEQKVFEQQVAAEVKSRCLKLLSEHKEKGLSLSEAIELLSKEPLEEEYAFID